MLDIKYRIGLLEQDQITKALKQTLERFGLEIIRVTYPTDTRLEQTTLQIQTIPNLSYLGLKDELDSTDY